MTRMHTHSETHETHLAIHKTLYKTQKTDDQGIMLDPIRIRNLTVGSGTPVHNLSKLCQLSNEHLSCKTELPRNSKSTKKCSELLMILMKT